MKSFFIRNILLIFLASLASSLTVAQNMPRQQKENKRKIVVEKPDLTKIHDETLNPSSKFYFPKLRAKYDHNDTTMTNEEYRYFYLGYMFQEDYDPYRVSEYADRTDELRQKATHTRAEIDTIEHYAKMTLKDNPFDLRQMSFLVHVLKERRKDNMAKVWEYRLEHLLGAIKSTGTGENVDNAWFVIYPMHEYDLIQMLGYEAVDVEYPVPNEIDRLMVTPTGETKKRLRGKVADSFYFNVATPTSQYIMKHPEATADDENAGVGETEEAETESEEPDAQ